jgi:hypothetical protein
MPRPRTFKIHKVYPLSTEEKVRILRKVNGKGGVQSFLCRLQDSVREDSLHLAETDFDWVVTNIDFVYDHEGAWQGRIPDEVKMDALEVASRPDAPTVL